MIQNVHTAYFHVTAVLRRSSDDAWSQPLFWKAVPLDLMQHFSCCCRRLKASLSTKYGHNCTASYISYVYIIQNETFDTILINMVAEAGSSSQWVFVCLFVVVLLLLLFWGVGVIILKNLMVDASVYPWPSVCGFDWCFWHRSVAACVVFLCIAIILITP